MPTNSVTLSVVSQRPQRSERTKQTKEARRVIRTLEVRELQDSISEVLWAVEEAGEIVQVTNHGRVVARLVPVKGPTVARSAIEEIIADMDSLAVELQGRLAP